MFLVVIGFVLCYCGGLVVNRKKGEYLRELKSDLCTSNITLSANSRSRTYARENPFKRDYYF